MSLAPDLQRMKEEYADRERRITSSTRYTVFNPAYLYTIHQRQRKTVYLLQKNGFCDLSNRSVLEVGCGCGQILVEYLGCGANPKTLVGIDLLPQRMNQAHDCLPHSPLTVADGQALPYGDESFDLVLQYTAFTSILDMKVKQNIAQQMLRVVKRDGMILWYDFWTNPTNKQTKGIGPNEIRQLFPDCRYEFHKITLAPPIAKIIVPISWGLALMLESLRVFNSHYMVALRPN